MRLREVTVAYGGRGNGRVVAVSGVDLDVMEGEVLGIVGRSGCGKTTLLKVMAGLVRPVSGEVVYGDGARNGDRPKIGMMFQSPLLLPWRTVLSNVLLPVEIAGEDRRLYEGRALELLELVGLKGLENRYPWELSGGMQQRVALCRALVHRPKLLLLDEPFSALDAITREEMWELLQSVLIRERPTTVLVTHDIREAVLLSDRVVVMASRPGRVKAEVKVPFGRPRPLEVQFTPEFNEYVARVRGFLG